MRKVTLSILVAMLTTLCLPAFAQGENPGGPGAPGGNMNPTIDGTWQLCMFQKGDSGKFELHVLPVLKIITEEGSYQTLLVRGTGAGCGIVEQGTYKKQNDSVLVETPKPRRGAEGEATAKQSVFHLQGPQWMVVNYKPEGAEKEVRQIWMRLREMPNARKMIEAMMNGDTEALKNKENFREQMRNRMGGARQQRRQMPNNNQSQQMENSNVDNSWMNED